MGDYLTVERTPQGDIKYIGSPSEGVYKRVMEEGEPEETTLYDGSDGDPTVVWFDPGGVTGWAVFSVHPDSLLDPEVPILSNVTHKAWGHLTGTEFSQVDQMLDLAREWPGAALGQEDFILRQYNMGRELLAPVRLSAAFRYGVGRGRKVWLQQPALAKTTITDVRLKQIGYYAQTEAMPHARDAIRHTLTFLKRLKTQRNLLKEVFPALLL